MNIFKIGPKIPEKLRVKQTKFQICQSQTKSDINWKYYWARKWIPSFEIKNSKLKTENRSIKEKTRNRYRSICCQTTQLIYNNNLHLKYAKFVNVYSRKSSGEMILKCLLLVCDIHVFRLGTNNYDTIELSKVKLSPFGRG